MLCQPRWVPDTSMAAAILSAISPLDTAPRRMGVCRIAWRRDFALRTAFDSSSRRLVDGRSTSHHQRLSSADHDVIVAGSVRWILNLEARRRDANQPGAWEPRTHFSPAGPHYPASPNLIDVPVRPVMCPQRAVPLHVVGTEIRA
jgi:hypothetical protein